MPVLTLFLDYKDAFTPCRPFLSRESAISWLQMIGPSMSCVGGIIETPPKTWTTTHLHEDEIRVSRWL
ncbi:hypothetical protein Scep_014827 [Stephania cephalantha]|uniref:Uncharacterized protein n=1 Tax=Stephania cephalantha TaxID=152367 RepID=A0AAP0P3D7_9MAGN